MANYQTSMKNSNVVITVHRGIDQIGGCITEISTDTSRVFVDFGQDLPGCAEPRTPQQDKALVARIFANNPKPHQAVVYTHAHEDHVGLFDLIPTDVPQYIGKGGHELLLARYELIKKQDILFSKANILVAKNLNDEGKQELYQEHYNKILLEDNRRIDKIKHFHTWERTKPHAQPQSFMIGNIRITPFWNCHSIYDSYMFLIEADGKRIWHTGDYRDHGYMGKGLYPTLRRYATDIDVLITEGTTLKRDDLSIHEREVSRRMACMMEAFKYVVVLASATDIERLAAIKEAAKKSNKELYICSGMMSRAMKIFTQREAEVSKELFEFHPKFVKDCDDPKVKVMCQKGFVLVTGVHQPSAEYICEDLPASEVLLIYSAWDGYYKDPTQVKLNPRYKITRELYHNVVDIHTSGHASRECIKKVIDIVKPKEVICIHKEAGAEL